MTVVSPIRDVSVSPLEYHSAAYLEGKKKRLTPKSQRGYRAILNALVSYYPTKAMEDFEPPAGAVLLEDFLTHTWGHRAPRTALRAVRLPQPHLSRRRRCLTRTI